MRALLTLSLNAGKYISHAGAYIILQRTPQASKDDLSLGLAVLRRVPITRRA